MSHEERGEKEIKENRKWPMGVGVWAMFSVEEENRGGKSEKTKGKRKEKEKSKTTKKLGNGKRTGVKLPDSKGQISAIAREAPTLKRQKKKKEVKRVKRTGVKHISQKIKDNFLPIHMKINKKKI